MGDRSEKVDLDDVGKFFQPLEIPDETLYNLSYHFSTTYRSLAANSRDQFLPIPIKNLPTGKEVGTYLAVYAGLYYLRVCFVELLGDAGEPQGRNPEKPRVRRNLEKAWPIESRLKQDNASELFAWIGDCIAEIVMDRLEGGTHGLEETRELDMGISFCFPIKQNSIDEAILMATGKGFALKSQLDLRQALFDGYECHVRRARTPSTPGRKRPKTHALPKLRITSMVNDTVATFASLAYSIRSLPNTRVVMGLLVGAGCNATVPMRLDDLHESKVQHILRKDPAAVDTLVTTEWTLSAASAPLIQLDLITPWDSQLDANGDRPGFQPLEYMVAGRYIGELVRIMVHDYFHTVLGVHDTDLPTQLVIPYALKTDFLSLVVAPSRDSEDLCVDLREDLPSPPSSHWQWTPASAAVLRSATTKIQRRAAGIIAAASVGLLACTREIKLARPDEPKKSQVGSTAEVQLPEKLLGDGTSDTLARSRIPLRSCSKEASATSTEWQSSSPEELVIAFSGGVIQHWPGFRESIQWHIDRLILRGGPQELGKSVFLREASDGGIIGVGVLAGTVAGSIEGIVGSDL
ncbi:hypothetical protein FE257_011164 [Aspergillus nanangensis]|uniref:Phosphotransferase n=1 Tax=Aspergillus nanangensis TaxID=2582783 RepID=A0AAD4CJK4_ASPNN|nr:hypothetical protein FE257_011164 [Aspergillus nanangensis]